MTGPSHIVVGLATAVVVCRLDQSSTSIGELLCLLFGALAPDIDGGGTITAPGRIFRVFVPRFIGDVIDAFMGLLSRVVGRVFGHRGFFHWPSLGLAIVASAIQMQSSPLWWFGAGYLSHLAADFLTVGGIPLFAPFRRTRFSARLMVTGSVTEAVVSSVLLVLVVGFGFELLPETLQNGFADLREHLLHQSASPSAM